MLLRIGQITAYLRLCKSRITSQVAGKDEPNGGPPIVGLQLTFRAELMPGREPIKRTFAVARMLANGRVELIGLEGQHAITEFERP